MAGEFFCLAASHFTPLEEKQSVYLCASAGGLLNGKTWCKLSRILQEKRHISVL